MGEQLTLYKKTVRKVPDYIQGIKTKFDSLGIFTINLGSDRKKSIELITIEYPNWIKLTITGPDIVDNYLRTKYEELGEWLVQWRIKEESNSGQNNSLIQEFDRIIEQIKIGILAVIFAHESNNNNNRLNFEEFEFIAATVFNAYKNLLFDNIVMNGKKDQFRTIFWPSGQTSISWQDFILLLNKSLILFIQGGINEIYLTEIKASLNIKNNQITFANLDNIFSYFWGSLRNFRRFINRNYLYGIINQGLQNNLVPYSLLSRNFNAGLPTLYITVTLCPMPNFTGKTFEIGPRGMEKSRRNVSDQIVTFGKDSNEEFTNDISIPNMQSLDNIFAFIFVNYKGYNLVDIAPRGSVKIKLPPNEEIRLEKDMVIIIGHNHVFVVDFDEKKSIPIGNNRAYLLTIKGNEDCKTTSKFGDVTPDDFKKKITIGRDDDNHVSLVHDDISWKHAECYYKQEDNSWYMKDLNSRNGTFYKLKKKTEICEANRNISNNWYDPNEGKPSEAYLIKHESTFIVENFTFYCVFK